MLTSRKCFLISPSTAIRRRHRSQSDWTNASRPAASRKMTSFCCRLLAADLPGAAWRCGGRHDFQFLIFECRLVVLFGAADKIAIAIANRKSKTENRLPISRTGFTKSRDGKRFGRQFFGRETGL